MNVLVAMDGSKYGRWALNWVAKLPFVEPAQVMVLHVLDSAKLRLPFRTKLETQRVEAHSARILKEATRQLASLKLTGTVRKEQGAVGTTSTSTRTPSSSPPPLVPPPAYMTVRCSMRCCATRRQAAKKCGQIAPTAQTNRSKASREVGTRARFMNVHIATNR